MDLVSCPQCAAHRLYRLADGRRMCCACRRKFRIRPRKSRLNSTTRTALLEAFWQGIPASRAANRAQVNVKTALRFYRMARAAIGVEIYPGGPNPTAHPSQAAAEPEGRRVAVFGILEGLRSVRVVMPGEAMRMGGVRNAAISWVYAPSASAAARLHIRSFFRIARSDEVRLWHGRAQIGGADSFWRFASERLKVYRGGYRFGFGPYLKEMAFRFNMRSRPDGFQRLEEAVRRHGPAIA